MVGAPVTVRGGFTRVTLAVGRWGSASFVATLPSLELKAHPAPAPREHAVRHEESVPLPPAVEVAVELVQTMAEKAPTLTVRRSSVVMGDEGGE
jgi:hypothetical protein